MFFLAFALSEIRSHHERLEKHPLRRRLDSEDSECGVVPSDDSWTDVHEFGNSGHP